MPQEFRDMAAAGNPYKAFWKSIDDAKRSDITKQELNTFDWCFRFAACCLCVLLFAEGRGEKKHLRSGRGFK